MELNSTPKGFAAFIRDLAVSQTRAMAAPPTGPVAVRIRCAWCDAPLPAHVLPGPSATCSWACYSEMRGETREDFADDDREDDDDDRD